MKLHLSQLGAGTACVEVTCGGAVILSRVIDATDLIEGDLLSELQGIDDLGIGIQQTAEGSLIFEATDAGELIGLRGGHYKSVMLDVTPGSVSVGIMILPEHDIISDLRELFE